MRAIYYLAEKNRLVKRLKRLNQYFVHLMNDEVSLSFLEKYNSDKEEILDEIDFCNISVNEELHKKEEISEGDLAIIEMIVKSTSSKFEKILEQDKIIYNFVNNKILKKKII